MTRRSRANPNRQHPQRDRIGEVGAAASLSRCVVLALAVGTWAVVSWRAGWWPFETDDAADAATVAATPQVVTVDEGSLTETVSAESTVAAADTDSLSFEASGTVSEVLVKEGDTVTAGQVMARLDSASLRADVADAQATVTELQAQIDGDEDGAVGVPGGQRGRPGRVRRR